MKMISKLRKIHKIEQKNCNKNYSAIIQVKPSMLDSHLGVHAFILSFVTILFKFAKVVIIAHSFVLKFILKF